MDNPVKGKLVNLVADYQTSEIRGIPYRNLQMQTVEGWLKMYQLSLEKWSSLKPSQYRGKHLHLRLIQ